MFHLVAHFAIRRLMWGRGISFVLTERSRSRGMTEARFVREAALNIQGFVVHGFLGPAALYLGWVNVGMQQANETTLIPPGVTTEMCTGIYTHVIFVGGAFGSWALFQISWLLLGWESGVDKWAHHLLFTFLVYAGHFFHVLPELTFFAVGMELSTPALCVLLTFREVVGYSQITALAKIIFALQFAFCRIFMFGYGLFRSLSLWYDPPSLSFLDTLDDRKAAMAFLHALYCAGYALQLFWGYFILSQVLRKFSYASSPSPSLISKNK